MSVAPALSLISILNSPHKFTLMFRAAAFGWPGSRYVQAVSAAPAEPGLAKIPRSIRCFRWRRLGTKKEI
jgi:hypothetical protein